MRWMGQRESDNVEDRRGMSGGRLIAGGGLGTLVIVVVAMLLGVDPSALLQGSDPGPNATAPAERSRSEDTDKQFVSVVLADTEDVWNDLFKRNGRTYREPRLVLFSDSSRSGCGLASAAIGPFYCPSDQTVYLDLHFFQELQSRFRAAGDFAEAYVVAHEVGHHVQNQLGFMNARRRSGETENQQSVRVELQADYLAGVWANHAQKSKNILEPGDLEEALRAANAIGDDQLQRQSRGYVVPDSFTHGTSEQRVRWFRKGFETGDLAGAVDLFNLNYRDL